MAGKMQGEAGVCVIESVELGEHKGESLILKGKRELKKEKLVFRKFEHVRKRPTCSSRNAVLARMNRLKKKYFLESLQKDVARLSDENAKLKQALEGMLDDFSVMEGLQYYLPSEVYQSCFVVECETAR